MNQQTTWPHHELGKELSNWGRWGDDDEIGTLNFRDSRQARPSRPAGQDG
jgi:hypothetical protein